MNSTFSKLTAIYALLSVLSAQSTVAQSSSNRQLRVFAGNSASARRPPLRHIGSIRVKDYQNGSCVIITSDLPVNDYMARRNGDLFSVTIPHADPPSGGIGGNGHGYRDAKIERQGSDTIFSFELDPGVGASVVQRFNRLEVTFVKLVEPYVDVDKQELAKATVADELNSPRATNPLVPNKPLAARPQAAGGGISQIDVDMPVPESPAFTVLGVTPENVTHPTTGREFQTALLNGVDQRGNFQTGLALDFIPYLTFAGKSTSLFSYKNSRMERFLARSQVSFATAKGATDGDKSTRLALGLRLTLWDTGDPRLDDQLESCYGEALNDDKFEEEEYLPAPGDSADLKKKKLGKRKLLLAEMTKPCDDEVRKRNWNASGWIVGLAPSWISKSGETKNFVWNGGGFWTSLAYGFDSVSSLRDNSQLVFHARYRTNEVIPDTDNQGQFLSQDSLFLGTRLRIAPGIAAKSIFSVEGNFIRSRRESSAFDNSSRYSLGLEQRLADNIWFSLALGGQSGNTNGNNQAFVMTSFKWGFTKKSPTTP